MTDLAAPAKSADDLGEKGLKGGALGLISSTVVGVASTAPAYSLASTLGNPSLFNIVKRGVVERGCFSTGYCSL